MAIAEDGLRRRGILSLVAGVAAGGPAAAQPGFPNRPIRIINPFAPGSPVDVIGRFAGDGLERALGQPVVVESHSGAGGAVGANLVAQAPADGHTLLVTTTSLIAATALGRSLPFDPMRDLVPVWAVVSSGLAIVVGPDVPARTLGEFIDYARARPGKLAYGTSGYGTNQHFGAALLIARTGIEMEHIPYRGGAPAATDLIAGHVQVMFDSLSNQLANIREGRVRALALMRPHRAQVMPELPTVAEAGVPGAEVPSWIGLFAPRGTPAAITERIASLLEATMAVPEARMRLATIGQEPESIAGTGFAAQVRLDQALFAQIAGAAGLRAE